MSEPLLNVMKVMLLAGLYLFFVRVLWSVFSELRDPRTVARKRAAATPPDARATARRAAPSASAAAVPSAPAQVPLAPAGGLAVAKAVGRLRILEPPQLMGTSYELGREITLGRAGTNGVVLDDTYVSTVHARIFQTNGGYVIEDLASRNGSMLNGQPLVATTELVPGDRLQVGATLMEFS